MTDAVMEALKSVDESDDELDGAAVEHDRAEEPGARPEGPLPDENLEPGESESDPKFSVLSWAKSVPDGSHRDFTAKDWWDPEGGAENRLAYHLSDATPEGAGYPNGIGVLVGFAELYWSRLKTESSSSEESESQGAPDAETVARDTAEGLV